MSGFTGKSLRFQLLTTNSGVFQHTGGLRTAADGWHRKVSSKGWKSWTSATPGQVGRTCEKKAQVSGLEGQCQGLGQAPASRAV